MNPIIPVSEFPFRRVSVTGGTGTIGRQWLKALIHQFPQVERTTTNCRPGRSQRIPSSPKIQVIEGGVDDVGNLKALIEAGDICYHLAAWLANLELPEPTEVYLVNGLVPAVVGRLCAASGKPLVFTSSHSVYFAGEYKGFIQEDAFEFRRDFMDWIEAVREPYCALADDLIARRKTFADARTILPEIHQKHAPPFDPKIYNSDSYHIYCLTKLLAERFISDAGGVILRLSNVYGPGDESVQAVAEACTRILNARPGDEIKVRQPFKKLVPCYMGDILKSFVRAGNLRLPKSDSGIFTFASQDFYMREDALLRAVAACVNEIRGTHHAYNIETLAAEDETAFTYDLTKMMTRLYPGEQPVPFATGLKEQLLWMMERMEGRPERAQDTVIQFAHAWPPDKHSIDRRPRAE